MNNVKQFLWNKRIEAVQWQACLNLNIYLHAVIKQETISLESNFNKIGILLEFEKSQNAKVVE